MHAEYVDVVPVSANHLAAPQPPPPPPASTDTTAATAPCAALPVAVCWLRSPLGT